ncbi:SusC/RagA family TonB-linked outer membrane protein [Marinoscillum sp. MHG1-6]|uniref:SusC/RagA family TonB-linked outer membrane protein n=1 Tax=Marinoscillum sp. MHG1-6 TaxID=2959627 RepID=UPI002157753F|nr:SusC/RagA family TonB-linked outer membrane protein [Marinoscillum sp. MHG1-6]
MKFIFAIALLTLSSGLLLGQDLSISGVVTDDAGDPIIGAQIKVDETSAITYTDALGKFTVALVDGYETLTITMDGYKTQRVFAGGLSRIDIILNESAVDSGALSVGYGSQSKKDVTGSISSIGGGEVASSPLINLEQANQGKAAGMFVQNSSGKLGGNTTVRVRGGSSLSNSNQPLYVVDGVPLVSGNQSNINPSNIASIEILKDASAAAIYGSRAANGVVIITTKSGSSGKIQIDADYQFGVSTTPKFLDLMSPAEFNQLVIDYTLQPFGYRGDYSGDQLAQWQSSGLTAIPINGDIVNMPSFYSRLDNDTDWQNEIFQAGLSHRANVGIQGGAEKLGYFASVGYNTQEGILIGNRFDRLNGSLSLNSQLSSRLSANANVNYIYTKDWKLKEDQDLGSPLQAIALPPSDTYNENNNYELENFSDLYNPLTEINFSDNLGFNNSIIASLGLTLDVTDQLTLDVNGGIDFSDLRDELRQGPETQEGGTTGRSELSETELRNYTYNGWLTYKPEMNSDQELSLVLGGSYQKATTTPTFRQANVNSIPTLEKMDDADSRLRIVDIPSGVNVLLSAFARMNYSYANKYILQLSGRMDASSKFGEDNRYGIFPAGSAGWVVSEEGFMADVPFISYLKFKGSYGIIGNVPIDDFLYRSNYFRATYGNQEAVRLANLANPQLKWESTAQLGLGVEFGFADRLTGSVDYYQKKTTDLLFPVPVTQTSGFNSVLKNVGAMENSGIEINLSSVNVEQNDFSWTTDFNISFFDNKVTDLNGSELIVGASAFLEGQPAGTFYLREYAGVDPDFGSPLWYMNRTPTATELSDGYVFKIPEFGDRYVTEEWEAAERIVAGNPNPGYYGGLTNTLSYKNIDFSFMFQFVGDVDVYYETGEFIANSGYQLLTQLSGQVDRWYTTADADAANPSHIFSEENTNPSTRWIEDGSYIRLKTLTLTYHLPKTMIDDWGIRYMDVYVGGTNLLTFTDYIGYDPDVNYVDPLDGVVGQNISRGIDNFTAPQPRMFITGIKIGL